MEKNEKIKLIKKLICSGLVIVAILFVIYLIMYLLGLTDLSREQIQQYVQDAGVWAPLIFIGISFLQVTFVPIPGAITIIAGSYVFGAWQSFLYSYVGMLLGSFFAFFLGRVIGRPFVNWIAGGKETADRWIKKLRGKENVLLFFMFLLPFFPDDMLCAVAGLFPMSWFTFTVMQLITRLTSISCTLIFMSGEIIPFYGWGLIVLGVVAVIVIVGFILCMKYSDKINLAFNSITDKINAFFKRRKNKKQNVKNKEPTDK